MKRGVVTEFLVSQIADGDDQVARQLNVGELLRMRSPQWQPMTLCSGERPGVDAFGRVRAG